MKRNVLVGATVILITLALYLVIKSWNFRDNNENDKYGYNLASVPPTVITRSGAHRKYPSNFTSPMASPHDQFMHIDTGPIDNLQHTSEIRTIYQRLDVCLASANMTEYFKRDGYLEKAQENARHYLKVLRSIIPSPEGFSEAYRSPCWETDFRAITKERGQILSEIGGKSILLNPMEYSGSPRNVLETIRKTFRGRFASNVACLPKIFVAGFPKCGTTFLYCLVTKGLGLRQVQTEKEPHWWTNAGPRVNPWKPAVKDVVVYLLNFVLGTLDNQAVTVDASVETILEWPRFYRGEPPVNYCLLPALIPIILPTSKYIVALRNPVSMLYSYFWFSCSQYGIKLSSEQKQRIPDVFHDRVVAKITAFNFCLRSESLEWCTVNITNSIKQFTPELPKCGRVWLGRGLYYVHIQRWLSVAPRERFHFVQMEEMSRETGKVAKKLWDFLDIIPGDLELHDANGCQKNEQHAVGYHSDTRLQMRRDTAAILEEFYRPFNQWLADLIGDRKFLWENT